jgi:hypothetical protein
MAYGAVQDPGYEARLAQLKTDQATRQQQAADHIKAVLLNAQKKQLHVDQATAQTPNIARLADAAERTATALERIATAQEYIARGLVMPPAPTTP